MRSDNAAIPIPISAYAPSNRMIRAPLSTPHTTARTPETDEATIEPISAARSPAAAGSGRTATGPVDGPPASGPSTPGPSSSGRGRSGIPRCYRGPPWCRSSADAVPQRPQVTPRIVDHLHGRIRARTEPGHGPPPPPPAAPAPGPAPAPPPPIRRVGRPAGVSGDDERRPGAPHGGGELV